MSGVNDLPAHGHVPYLLDLAHRRMSTDLAGLVAAHKHPELRGSHFRVLTMIPAEGTRPSVLAEIAAMTRPALGELVAHLEEHGYVAVQPDPTDGRAVIIALTRRGRNAAAEAQRAISELKQRWTEEIGSERLDALLASLAALTVDRQRG